MTNQIQLSEETKVWLAAWADNVRYCHYFAVSLDDDKHLMGTWNAPFYSFEEAQQFAKTMQAEKPDSELVCIEGITHIDGAMKNTPNKFWATWQKKHKQRIAALTAMEA